MFARLSIGILTVAALSFVTIGGCSSPEDFDDDVEDDGVDALTAPPTAFRPTHDVQKANVVGVGDPVALFKDVDEAASDDNTTYVRGVAGTALTSHTVGYSASGAASQVKVVYRAQRGSAQGTAQVHLYQGTTLLAKGAVHSLGAWANYSDVFSGLSVLDASKLQTKIVFNNTKGAGALRYTQVWIEIGGTTVADAGTGDATCVPTTCAALGKNCGSVSNGCQGTLSCGSCTAPQTCGGGGTANVCGTAPTTGIATDANLKVAYIGDTNSSANFKSVLNLVKNEGADMVMVEGDLMYSGATGAQWLTAIDSVINNGTVRIPYFVAKGNHDTDWNSTIAPGLKTRLQDWGITPDNGDPTTDNYAVTYRGMKMVMVTDTETSPTRADYVSQQLTGDNHLFKTCAWHKNQRATNVGPKSDEMGWAIYENCRNAGAIVAQGHSHTYSRSKTIINDTNQTVDATCSDPFNLCVSKGRHFFLDSSLGGVDTRTLDATIAAKPYWGATYTGNFGALFIEYNVNADPRQARGYFKTVGGTVIDPPAGSGKTYFNIQSGN